MSTNLHSLPFQNHEKQKDTLYSDVNKIPDSACLPLAIMYENMAKLLRDRHETYLYKQAVERSIKGDLAELKRLPVTIFEQLKSGHDFGSIIDILTDGGRIPEDTIYSHWLRLVKDAQEQNRFYRNDRIYQMIMEGHSNAEVAEQFKVSIGTVNKVYQAKKKELKK